MIHELLRKLARASKPKINAFLEEKVDPILDYIDFYLYEMVTFVKETLTAEHASQQFLYKFIFAGILIMVIANVLFSVSYLGITKSFTDSSTTEKLSSYECGFSPFEDTRSYFDVRFYLVGIMFILFDIELVILYTWCINAGLLGLSGYIVMLIFVLLLLIGFLYEYINGALDFE